MNCLKCGREIEDGSVFCQDCLAGMQQYPVKDGTAILLPTRRDSHAPRRVRPRRRPPTPEEQLQRLRMRLFHIIILWLLTLALLAATVYPAVSYFLDRSIPRPGQNYTAITSTEPK